MPRKARRDTVTYQLKHDRKVVYTGTTVDPVGREHKHRAEGKRFTKLVVVTDYDGGWRQEEKGRRNVQSLTVTGDKSWRSFLLQLEIARSAALRCRGINSEVK